MIKEFIINNYDSLYLIVCQIVALSSVIVKLTPTLKDDHIMKKVLKFMGNYMALNNEIKKVVSKSKKKSKK